MTKLTIGVVAPGDTAAHLETVDWGLDYIQDAVGGYIEHVTLIRGEFGLYINETGKIQDPPLPINEVATQLYRASRKPGDFAGNTIEGVALMVSGPDDEGDDLSLSDRVQDMLARTGLLVR